MPTARSRPWATPGSVQPSSVRRTPPETRVNTTVLPSPPWHISSVAPKKKVSVFSVNSSPADSSVQRLKLTVSVLITVRCPLLHSLADAGPRRHGGGTGMRTVDRRRGSRYDDRSDLNERNRAARCGVSVRLEAMFGVSGVSSAVRERSAVWELPRTASFTMCPGARPVRRCSGGSAMASRQPGALSCNVDGAICSSGQGRRDA